MIQSLIFALTLISSSYGQAVQSGNEPAVQPNQGEDRVPVPNYVCPSGTLNAGWTVASSPAFKDAAQCCDVRTQDWEVGSQYDSWYMETGCGLTYPLLHKKIYQYVYPIYCESNTDCGDYSMDGTAIECCSSGYCAGLSVNGTSRCPEVTEMWTWDGQPQSDYEAQEYKSDPVDDYISACEAKKSSVCLGCADDCSSIGGMELWSAKDSPQEEASAPSGLRSFSGRPGLGSGQKLIARRRLARSKRALRH